jgi:opacity protein-like surface antigen
MSLQPISARVLSLALATLLAASPALAEDKEPLEHGWDRDVGLLVSLNNPFQNSDFLSTYQGYGLAALFTFNPTTALRAGIDIGRVSDPYFVTESELEFDGETTTVSTFSNRYGGPTSIFDMSLGADVLKRGSKATVAPYYGGGLGLTLGSESTQYNDEVTTEDVVTHVDTKSKTFQFGLRGVVGADWRVHQHFSLFAEYGLGISLVDSLKTTSSNTLIDSTGDDTQTTLLRSTSKQSLGPAMGTDLSQGASLGLIAFF